MSARAVEPGSAANGARALRRAIVLLGLVALALGVLHGLFSDWRAHGVYWFHLDKERNPATWFSGVLLALFGAAALAAHYWEWRRNREGVRPGFPLPSLWLGVALIAFLLSLDEITILHENLMWREVRLVSAGLGDRWKYVTQWQLLYAPAILAVAGYLAVFFVNRFRLCPTAGWSASAGLACWVLANLLEGVRQGLKQTGGYGLAVVVEEELEMFGAILLAAAVARYAVALAADVTVGHRRDLAAPSRFLTRRAVLALAGLCGLLVAAGALVHVTAGRLEAQDAPVPGLVRRALAESDAAEREADGSAGAAEAWFDDVTEPLPFPADADPRRRAGALGALIGVPGSGPPLPDLERDQAPRLVFVSTSDGTSTGRVYLGFGRGLRDALRDALGRAQGADPAHEIRLLKLDLVSRVETRDGFDWQQPLPLEPGVTGVALGQDSGVALLPDELPAQDLYDDEKRLRPDRVLRYLRDRPRTGRAAAAGAGDRQRVHLFTTESFLWSEDRLEPLYRGHELFDEAPRERLLAAARRGGEYLLRSVDEDGRYVYSYRAETDSLPDEYNVLRHAGTTYALLELYAEFRDERFLAAAERALGYLLDQGRPCTARGRAASCVVEDDHVKLGGNALAVIALAKHAEVTGRREHVPAMVSLAEWMLAVQDPDGRFAAHKVSFPDGVDTGFVSAYYPGEALLALVRLHGAVPDSRWVDAADRGARWVIEVRDGGRSDAELAHDHWLLYALNELHRLHPQPVFLRHALRMADAIVASQHRNPLQPDWVGGYYVPPRSTPTAIRSEGLAAAYALARAHDPGRGDAILAALWRGVGFQLRTQVSEASAFHLPDPPRALGGFRADLESYEVRIDYVQHNVSSLLLLHALTG